MLMQIDNTKQIIEIFNLQPGDNNDLKRQLRRIQKRVHPDANGGDFSSEEEEQYFHRIEEAILALETSLESRQSTLVQSDSTQELVKLLRDIVAPAVAQSTQQSIEQSAISCLDRSISQIKAPLGFPRIALSTLSVAITAIWAFPGTISSHPVLGRLINITSSRFLYVWLGTLVITSCVWLRSWYQESKHKRTLSALRTEQYQNALFLRFMETIRYGVGDPAFTKDLLIDYIRNPYEHDSKYYQYMNPYRYRIRFAIHNLFSIAPIDLEPAESAADLLLTRLLKRDVIQLQHSKGLSDRYMVPNFDPFESNF
jgi:hypothetical protein